MYFKGYKIKMFSGRSGFDPLPPKNRKRSAQAGEANPHKKRRSKKPLIVGPVPDDSIGDMVRTALNNPTTKSRWLSPPCASDNAALVLYNLLSLADAVEAKCGAPLTIEKASSIAATGKYLFPPGYVMVTAHELGTFTLQCIPKTPGGSTFNGTYNSKRQWQTNAPGIPWDDRVAVVAFVFGYHVATVSGTSASNAAIKIDALCVTPVGESSYTEFSTEVGPHRMDADVQGLPVFGEPSIARMSTTLAIASWALAAQLKTLGYTLERGKWPKPSAYMLQSTHSSGAVNTAGIKCRATFLFVLAPPGTETLSTLWLNLTPEWLRKGYKPLVKSHAQACSNYVLPYAEYFGNTLPSPDDMFLAASAAPDTRWKRQANTRSAAPRKKERFIPGEVRFPSPRQFFRSGAASITIDGHQLVCVKCKSTLECKQIVRDLCMSGGPYRCSVCDTGVTVPSLRAAVKDCKDATLKGLFGERWQATIRMLNGSF